MLAISKNKAINLKTQNISKETIHNILDNASPFWSKAKIINYLYLMNDDYQVRRAIDDYADDNNLIHRNFIEDQKKEFTQDLATMKDILFYEIGKSNSSNDRHFDLTTNQKLYSLYKKFIDFYGKMERMKSLSILFMTLRSFLHAYNRLHKSILTKQETKDLSIVEKFNLLEKEYSPYANNLKKVVSKPYEYSSEKEKRFIRKNQLNHKRTIDINDKYRIKKLLSKISKMNIPNIYFDGCDVRYYLSDIILEYFKIKVFLHNVFLHEIPALLYYRTFKSQMFTSGCWLIAIRTIYINLTGRAFGLHKEWMRKSAKKMLKSEKLFKYLLDRFSNSRGGNNYTYKRIFPKVGFVPVIRKIRKRALGKVSFKSAKDFTEKNISKIIRELGPIYLAVHLKKLGAGHAFIIYGAYKGKVYFSDHHKASGRVRAKKIEDFISEFRIKFNKAFVHRSYKKSTSQTIDTSLLEELKRF